MHSGMSVAGSPRSSDSRNDDGLATTAGMTADLERVSEVGYPDIPWDKGSCTQAYFIRHMICVGHSTAFGEPFFRTWHSVGAR
jgi:hypothetical protein